MSNQIYAYGKLCTLFYNATKTYAPEKEVNFYASFMNKNSRVLEAMSGSGRLQIPLIQLGFTVDGVDNSSVMLNSCRARCADLKLSPEIYEQSLENLDLPHKYQTVTIAVGSFQLIVDRVNALKSLKNIRAHMSDNGDLLIDIFVPDQSIDSRSTRIVRIDDNTIIRLTTRYVFNNQEKIADAFCLYELIRDGVIEEQENELMQVTWYDDNEFRELLNKAGFEVVNIYQEIFRASGPSRVVHAKPNL